MRRGRLDLLLGALGVWEIGFYFGPCASIVGVSQHSATKEMFNVGTWNPL